MTDFTNIDHEEHRFCADCGTIVLRRPDGTKQWYMAVMAGHQTENEPALWIKVTDRQAEEVSAMLREQCRE